MEAAYLGFGCAGGGGGGGIGGSGWVAVAGPEFRREVRSMDDYMRTISWNISNLGPQQPAPVHHHQQMQMRQQMSPAHPVQAVHHPVQAVQGGNSLVPAMPQAATNIAAPTRMPSQMQGIIKAKKQHSESTPMPEQVLNSQPGGITPSAPPPNKERSRRWRNQPGRRTAQPEGTQCQAQSNPAARVMLQNSAAVGRPNAQQVHLLRQNVSGGVSMQPTVSFQIQQQQQQEQLLMRMNHQRQMQMQMQRDQMHGTQQIRVPPPEPVTAVDHQQSNSSCLKPENPTTMESVEGVDRRDEIFQKISSLKDAYFSDLMELNISLVDLKMEDEELESLPKHAQAYGIKSSIRDRTRTALKFLQLQKSCIDERTEEELCRQESSINELMDFRRKREAVSIEIAGVHLPQLCQEPPQSPHLSFFGRDDHQSDEQEKPAQSSVSQLGQNNSDDATTFSSDFQQLLQKLQVGFFRQVLDERHEVKDFQKALDELPEDDVFQLLDQVHDDRAEAAVAKKRPFDHLINDDDAETAVADGPTPATGTESSPRSSPKKQKTDNGDSALVREIKAINDKLIDTMITVTAGDDGGDSGRTTSIRFTYTAVALASDMKKLITSCAGTSLVKSANLTVPADYPLSSPVLLDDEPPPPQQSGVDAAFQSALGELTEPRSIEQMARAWDASVRGAVAKFARRRGGGTFSSAYGRWKSCTGKG
uniref:ARC105/Med15 mediator subunit C-terminal domain-containing protein n=1 Tax=Oryza punctata TaxID=4537 RepID=A0A0E0ML15_ORYPU